MQLLIDEKEKRQMADEEISPHEEKLETKYTRLLANLERELLLLASFGIRTYIKKLLRTLRTIFRPQPTDIHQAEQIRLGTQNCINFEQTKRKNLVTDALGWIKLFEKGLAKHPILLKGDCVILAAREHFEMNVTSIAPARFDYLGRLLAGYFYDLEKNPDMLSDLFRLKQSLNAIMNHKAWVEIELSAIEEGTPENPNKQAEDEADLVERTKHLPAKYSAAEIKLALRRLGARGSNMPRPKKLIRL